MLTYQRFSPVFPHGKLTEVFDNIWFIQGSWDMPVVLKPRISRSMVVIRCEDGALTLINSMRLSEEALSELEALGPIKHVIRLAAMHGADDRFYKARYNAKVYALAGTGYHKGLSANVDDKTTYFQPDIWFDEDTPLPVGEAYTWVMRSSKLAEACILLKRDRGILLSGDMLHNTPQPDAFTNLRARLMMRVCGLTKACNVGVGWWMMNQPSGDELRAILSLPFQHVLPVHGEPVIGNAKARYRDAIETYAAKADAKNWHSPLKSPTC
ncbi:hypothetical protein LJ739_07885 [Aestuariibacter halophilus]|uniref:MBL fold metallo-hydrolase n=1 Tax=Fluctibacter halophilus TaxID=226011 RepID=A0ABS8GAA8_9ALTE|nr:hypothetical protein [Aestuariibacter halophilus]MCC2616156.1 hypothetical protein [Aestuariibacter halophilus]